ncbi:MULTISPECIES: hypothetical protein [unclassified Sulfitobacter]|nr:MULTISPECIES: hypothetical protein [unclassified Sulfitobacter]MDF3420890.1 hypothetical protein [Sulfitobacter sp. KE43]MDF3461915.1 hypothetical protein [Sulfitobacter sp. Ks18]MDF3469711.1 hypothetical protein [Sulfitobacter sp. M28]MDF3496865.1 hypothetical protein [Sulfitobacter sp. M56]MDF3524169.1 hypothetical protein [Sulfitobacter sp. S66]MDF3531975.1 hypothetical protein [Sulfitobacter sp. S62]MDF3539787.1 hypothetical protein [Sulfitobacter sp. M62]
MLKTISLILPVLIPSWRFFKAVEPSPRVEWAIVPRDAEGASNWTPYQPRPQAVSLGEMFRRLLWNPAWNDALFVVSCAERIALGIEPTSHSVNEIQRRILRDINGLDLGVDEGLMQFRLVFVYRDDTGFVQDVVFVSEPVPVRGAS